MKTTSAAAKNSTDEPPRVALVVRETLSDKSVVHNVHLHTHTSAGQRGELLAILACESAGHALQLATALNAVCWVDVPRKVAP